MNYKFNEYDIGILHTCVICHELLRKIKRCGLEIFSIDLSKKLLCAYTVSINNEVYMLCITVYGEKTAKPSINRPIGKITKMRYMYISKK